MPHLRLLGARVRQSINLESAKDVTSKDATNRTSEEANAKDSIEADKTATDDETKTEIVDEVDMMLNQEIPEDEAQLDEPENVNQAASRLMTRSSNLTEDPSLLGKLMNQSRDERIVGMKIWGKGGSRDKNFTRLILMCLKLRYTTPESLSCYILFR